MNDLDIPAPYQRLLFNAAKKAALYQEKLANRKPFSASLSRKLCEPKDEIRRQVKKKNRQLVVRHHSVMDFIEALFRDLEPPAMNPEYEIAGKDKG
jgi:hypothetical protein